jgi:Kef-type K+ transport system membrane component KefB
VVGVAVPFVVGFAFVYHVLGHQGLVAVFIGVTLTATSVGITARARTDLGRLQQAAAQVVLAAAVVDDILGLIILAAVTGIAQSRSVSPVAITVLVSKAVTFLVMAVVVGIPSRHCSCDGSER